MDFIVLEGMSHVYKSGDGTEYAALNNLSLKIKRGEFVAILGTNGSGKSTLAKHLNALLVPTSGRCVINGLDTREADKIWEIRQQVGMVFQNPDNQIIAAVVEDDVAFGPENLGVPPDEIAERVTASLEAVGMSDYRGFEPHLLSGGQKQRIAIAGALAMQTGCLVLDEPTAMLDPKGRQEVMQTVKRLNHDMGMTIVYITHFMEEAAEADRVIILDKGAAVEIGTPREVFSRPEIVKKYGLDVPLAVKLADKLRKKGIKLAENILTDEELVEAICR